MENKVNININTVKDRILFMPLAVKKSLESEAMISDFDEKKELISEGQVGRIFKVQHKKTGGVYALKAIDKRKGFNEKSRNNLNRQIEIMYKIRHPNIVRLFSHFEDDNYCYLLMEYISKCNLYESTMKKKKKCQDIQSVANIMRDLLSAVYYLHNMDPPIIHRGIDPENVLIH